MNLRKTVFLDGGDPSDSGHRRVREALLTAYRRRGDQVRVYELAGMKLAHCVGCFGCWVRTPGICIHNDAGRGINREIINSDEVVLFSPVVFGGYSEPLKRMVDRFIPLLHPNVGAFSEEIHHVKRYARYPRLVSVGIQKERDADEEGLFIMTAGRNAINFHAPSYATEVVRDGTDLEELGKVFAALIDRSDEPASVGDVRALMKRLTCAERAPSRSGGKRALLVVGSPKTGASTSAELGSRVMRALEAKGWHTGSVKIRKGIFAVPEFGAFADAVGAADLVVLAFPLYIDALPALVIKALEAIRNHYGKEPPAKSQRFFAIANNGFAENYQNAPALAMCRRFAIQSGMEWAGCLAMGAGETLCAGQSLTSKERQGPPIDHVVKALDRTTDALDRGTPIPVDVYALIARSPIPCIPFGLWRWMFPKLAATAWRKQAAQYGIGKEEMNVAPYA